MALQVATDPSYVATFGAAGSQALVQLLLEIQHYGILAAQVFFGLWLAPLGYLAYRSGLFPKALGVILVVATVSYLFDVVVAFLLPDLAKQIHIFLTIAPAISEIWMVFYLLVVGVRSPRRYGSPARRRCGAGSRRPDPLAYKQVGQPDHRHPGDGEQPGVEVTRCSRRVRSNHCHHH